MILQDFVSRSLQILELNLERSLMTIPVRSHKQDLGLKQDFVCLITTDFGTTSGEIMPDES